MIKERIDALRRLMAEWGWDAAVTVGEDPHNSEYTPLRWCQRQFISGFAGSAGVVVITKDHAGLWTDSRYWIQAVHELEGSGIELHKMVSIEDKDWIRWIADSVPQDGKVGIDGLCMSMGEALQLENAVAFKGASVVSKPDYLEALWPDRPLLPQGAVRLHEDRYAGRSRIEKLEWLRSELSGLGCHYMFLNCLDQIAWLLNIRSNDVEYCPFVISFALVCPDSVELFAETSKFRANVLSELKKANIRVHPYGEVGGYIGSLKADGKILIDSGSLNYETGKAIAEKFGRENIVEECSPVDLAKAVKNEVEIEGFRKAYIQDGIVQTRFFMWLEESLADGKRITESDASDKLHDLRTAMPDFLDESFETISAYGQNAALPHYSTVRGQDAVLEPHGLYLNDSGAHYSYGTTDITRTVPLGPLTDLEREDYTLDMMAMIDLAMAVFPEGTPGCRIDAIARRPLWQAMRNFGHGTGHGVGNVLSVHEGPQSIRQNLKDQPLLPGMITSDEPGIYREGFHGIRHENMILCTGKGGNEFGRWICFETLTRTYLDTAPLLISLMDCREIEWLNDFNETVYCEISPYLEEEEKVWLRKKTLPLEF
ncbi:MAG: aminopeptidase P family protein [Bacteroidaceae bacterium]|nr:aminopeptidase P family protein [Bacteroidaceae bacterium]